MTLLTFGYENAHKTGGTLELYIAILRNHLEKVTNLEQHTIKSRRFWHF
jgi:hypothetical protein